MKQPKLTTQQEKQAFHQGYAYGYREGMQKVSMMIQLILNSTEDFEKNILQNSEEANEPWFVGKDVAEILGYIKARNAISNHVDEDDALKWGLTDSVGRTQETIIINESGLYSLILSSKIFYLKSRILCDRGW